MKGNIQIKQELPSIILPLRVLFSDSEVKIMSTIAQEVKQS